MIDKFKTIKNLAVYQNFKWDETIRDKGNNIEVFKKINIIYGRNYSGKTTLSRIIRAMETGQISDKYENPEFEISIKDSSDITQTNLLAHSKKIRVFNDDFVRENLRFILDSDENISPFAILGENGEIEKEIQSLKNELGDNEDKNESGFYLEYKTAKVNTKNSKKIFEVEKSKLDKQLKEKATKNSSGIKYKSEKFGDQNYNITKLLSDIETILETLFQPLTDVEVRAKEALLDEKTNSEIPIISKPNLEIQIINTKAKELVTKSISNSNKIEQLLKDAILNRWVKEGKQIYKHNPKICAFCGNDISQNRWHELESHFDEESEKLEQEIETLISCIENKINSINSILPINKALFYSKFHSDLNNLIIQRQELIDSIKSELNRIKSSLQERKNDLLNSKEFIDITDSNEQLEICYSIFENLRNQANEYSSSLEAEQTEAKKLLRLREVSDFVMTIKYSDVKNNIETLETIYKLKEQEEQDLYDKIKRQKDLIEEKERLMNDEEEGALKVNEHLNNFFGHESLTLQAKEDETEKKIRFEILRNGKKAYHLSEGECSLIAFCYFLAKLEDIETKGSKPIIWIDDPISSLDTNHIFFIYSLINAEIISKEEYEQIFISTHNLDFLKYLKRLPMPKKECNYFLISRENENSKIKLMPTYLKDYITEFNFLFHQIYKCSLESIEEEEHNLFYNFGNNTRKFLEAFLYYKYPNKNDNKLEKFFGGNRQASTMTDRIINEFSHLEGIFERSMTPIDIPEMRKTARFILNKIEENDTEQYEALLESIGITKN